MRARSPETAEFRADGNKPVNRRLSTVPIALNVVVRCSGGVPTAVDRGHSVARIARLMASLLTNWLGVLCNPQSLIPFYNGGNRAFDQSTSKHQGSALPKWTHVSGKTRYTTEVETSQSTAQERRSS